MRSWLNLAVAALLTLLCACGGRSSATIEAAPTLGLQGSPDAGTTPLPGEPTLAAGARTVPDMDADVPLPKAAAQAGVDFASNRFIIIFESQPQSPAVAPYLDGDPPETGTDAVLPRDNALLVQHPYLRKVSTNLAAKYGLSVTSRVFYKNVNFAVVELPRVRSVTDLDAKMRKVLNENPGLVREVCYDFYAHAVGGPVPAGSLLPEDIRALPKQHPVSGRGAAPLAALETPRGASSAPAYDNPDPYYMNQPGFNLDLGDGADDSGSWALWRIGATLDEGWSYTTGSSTTVIAVVDTGVRYTHEDLADNCVDPLTDPPYSAPGILTDVFNRDNDPMDDYSHGTFCAGEIAAKGNNGKGTAGVCWDTTLLPIKVLDSTGNGSDGQIAEGMLLADRLGANILSMSLGSLFGLRALQLAAKQCNTDGLLVCAAATNYNVTTPFYPAYYPECLAVGASALVNDSNNEDFSRVDGALPVDTRYDVRAGFSNYGPWVDIAAPGVNVLGTYYSSDSSYIAAWGGTSMATPYVAGCAGLLWSYISNPTNDKVRGLLQSSETKLDHLDLESNPHGFIDDSSNGNVGCVNVYRALQLYASGTGTAPTVVWDNPSDGAIASGTVELRVAVSGGAGTVSKVEFETPYRLLGVQTAPSGGLYRQDWDSAYEFNRPIELRAKAYDDMGNIVSTSITATPSNSRKTPNSWSEAFDGLAADTIPAGWYILDGNQASSGNTSWGADLSQFNAAAPSMHTSGSTANYADGSSDWLIAPIIDLKNYGNASISFERRFQIPAPGGAYFLITADDRTYVHPFFSNSNLDDWAPYSFNLSGFAGKEVRVGWALDAIGASSAPGMWIDDLSLTAEAGTPPTITIDSPANGASVSGLVPINVTVSDDTQWITLTSTPPTLNQQTFTPIPDNDAAHPTKTYTINWDSRSVYNGAALLTLLARDDENGDNIANDLTARATVSLSVTNPTRDPMWYEGFEGIANLGGFSGPSFDGDWFVQGSGADIWHVTSSPGLSRTGATGCKFGPAGAGNYSPNQFGMLYSPVHDCSSATHPFLRFWQQLDVGDSGADTAALNLVQYDELDDVNIPISRLKSDTSPAGQWQEVDVSLEAWKSRKLRFEFTVGIDSDANVGTGWLIDDYEVLDANPHINSLSPAGGLADGNTQVAVNGLRFGSLQGSSTVSFAKAGGGRAAAQVVSWSNTQVVVKVPANATSGNVIVNLLGYNSNGVNFFAGPLAVSFTGIDPQKLYGSTDIAVPLAVTASSGIDRLEIWVDGVKYGSSIAAPAFAGLNLNMAQVPNGHRSVVVHGFSGAIAVLSAPAPLHVYSLPGDINCDGGIGAADTTELWNHLGAVRPMPGYEPWYDPDDDGLVTEADLSYLGYHWGEANPLP